MKFILFSLAVFLTACSYGLDKTVDNSYKSSSFASKNPEKTRRENFLSVADSQPTYRNIADVINLNYKNFNIQIELIDYKAYLNLYSKEILINNSIDIEFDYIYSETIDTAIKKIKIFDSNKSDHKVLLLPTATEEFPTYLLLLFNNKGISHSYTIEVRDSACEDFDQLSLDNIATFIKLKSNFKEDCKGFIIDRNSIK